MNLWCSKGNHFADESEFYSNPRSKTGKTAWCKTCMKKHSTKRTKRLRYQQARYDSPENKARQEVKLALKRGEMIKPKYCADRGKPLPGKTEPYNCEGERLEFHHTGTAEIPDPYHPSNWRVGVFVCNSHHKAREGKI